MTKRPDQGHTIRVTLNGKSFTCRRTDLLKSIHRDVDVFAMLDTLTSDGRVVVRSSHNKPMTISLILEEIAPGSHGSPDAGPAAEPESAAVEVMPLQAYQFGIRLTLTSEAGEAVIRATSEEEALRHLQEMIRYREGSSGHGHIDLNEAVADITRQLRFRDRTIGREHLHVLETVKAHRIPTLTYDPRDAP
jgi:hypothetical protein